MTSRLNTKYIFENKDKRTFQECTGDEMRCIIDGVNDDRAEFITYLPKQRWISKINKKQVLLNGIYRIRDPSSTPNKIDWAQVPPEFRYCYTSLNWSVLTKRLPLEKVSIEGVPYLTAPVLKCEFIKIDDGDYGFIRGTVDPINSLLVRPE